ncbi:hypothetical protein [Streptomyces sp. BK340]|nr:hypothetical protein [Streptomyces sp. BK340]TVZ96538.1 hypothetical protein FB157_103449 [Streptomyces sp. BK340]
MPQIIENIGCPTPGCGGSRADIWETDENGNKIARVGSQPCGQCGQ